MKKIGLLIIIIFFFTGCTSYTELNDLLIVNTIGISKEDNEYIVTIATVDTNNYRNNNNYEKIIYTEKDEKLTQAFNKLYLSLDKEIYIYHLETLVLSSTLNYQDINNINSYFNNIKNNRNSFVITYTNSNIEDILKNNTNINSLLKINSNNYSLAYPITYEKYLKNLNNDKYSFLPTINIDNNKLKVYGYSYFYNNKYINLLTEEESISYNILNNYVNSINLSINNEFYSITNIDCNDKLHSKKNIININSSVYSKEDNYVNIYNRYLKKILKNFIDKYSYYQEYKINTYTKGANYEK